MSRMSTHPTISMDFVTHLVNKFSSYSEEIEFFATFENLRTVTIIDSTGYRSVDLATNNVSLTAIRQGKLIRKAWSVVDIEELPKLIEKSLSDEDDLDLV